MIERRPFGRTGHLSTATLFGGAALARASQADADRTLDLLLRYGVNHIDTAARYGDSELRIGPWMARHRKDFFMAQQERYRRDFEEVQSICRERNVAVQVIKSIARGPWATVARTHTTWYQPLEERADIDRAVHWALGLPGVFLNTAGDLALLPTVLDAASRFERRPSDDEMAAMLDSTRMTSLFGLAT